MKNIKATEEERARRKAICAACPFVVEVAARPMFCGKCGCPLVTKTAFASASCPAKKW